MIMVAIVAARPEHQEAKQQVVTREEAVRADDFGPAVVGDEAITEIAGIIGFGLPPLQAVLDGGEACCEIRVEQHGFAHRLREMVQHRKCGNLGVRKSASPMACAARRSSASAMPVAGPCIEAAGDGADEPAGVIVKVRVHEVVSDTGFQSPR